LLRLQQAVPGSTVRATCGESFTASSNAADETCGTLDAVHEEIIECIAELEALNAPPNSVEDEEMASVDGDELSPNLVHEKILSGDDDLGSGEDVAALDGDLDASLILDHGLTQNSGDLHGIRAAANTHSIDYEGSQASSSTLGPDKPQAFATVVITSWAIREDSHASLNPDGLGYVQEDPENLHDLLVLEPVALDEL
jgi:hypothetical protein